MQGKGVHVQLADDEFAPGVLPDFRGNPAARLVPVEQGKARRKSNDDEDEENRSAGEPAACTETAVFPGLHAFLTAAAWRWCNRGDVAMQRQMHGASERKKAGIRRPFSLAQ